MGVATQELTVVLFEEEEKKNPYHLLHKVCLDCLKEEKDRGICGIHLPKDGEGYTTFSPDPSSKCVVCLDYLSNLSPAQWHALHT